MAQFKIMNIRSSAGVSLIIAMFLACPAGAKLLLIDDFNSGLNTNKLGGQQGDWEADPNDETQGCECVYTSSDNFIGTTGKSLRITYDVDSPNPAYNGFWMKLNGVDARPYKQVIFFARGDESYGYPTRINVEIKNAREVGKYTVRGLDPKWRKFVIPFEAFKGITDWSSLTEFVLVFADTAIDKKVGRIYFDDLYLSDGEAPEAPAPAPPIPEAPPQKPAEPAMAAVLETAKKEKLEVKMEDNAVVITVHINFGFNKTDVAGAEKKKVGEVAEVLAKFPTLKVLVEGYTDNTGDTAANKRLSLLRARSVAKILAGLGVDKARIKTAGKGKANPVAPNNTPAGRAKNRRVVFVIEK
jgi:outer membrane protein OmpA-like peptidoglycan-associated protein